MRINAGKMAFAWLVALSLAGMMISSVAYIGQRRLEAKLADHDVIFIGTSLMRYALPSIGEDGGPIPSIDANRVLRIGISNGSEDDLLDLTKAAVRAGVGMVFVEINPIVSRFSNSLQPCGLWRELGHRQTILQRSADIFGIRNGIIQSDSRPADNDRPRFVNTGRVAAAYPLHFDVPCYATAWQRVAASAGTTQIILIAMPRDGIARDYIGARGMADFDRASRKFALRLGLPLFVPDVNGSWNEDHFLDRAHLSARGAERFQQELSIWLDSW